MLPPTPISPGGSRSQVVFLIWLVKSDMYYSPSWFFAKDVFPTLPFDLCFQPTTTNANSSISAGNSPLVRESVLAGGIASVAGAAYCGRHPASCSSGGGLLIMFSNGSNSSSRNNSLTGGESAFNCQPRPRSKTLEHGLSKNFAHLKAIKINKLNRLKNSIRILSNFTPF